MPYLTGADVVTLIQAARTADDVFGDCGGVRRRIVRKYRQLAFSVHPDRCAQEGIEQSVATSATRRLNELFAQADPAAPTSSPAQPRAHLVGRHGTYMLAGKIRFTGGVGTYATAEPNVFAVIARSTTAGKHVLAFREAIERAASNHMAPFVPTFVDAGVTSDRAWMVYSLPEGLHSLRNVLAAYPSGLDARDWAWMYRRILMTLDAAGVHGNLSLDTVQIHAEHHGVVLLDFEPADATLQDDAQALSEIATSLVSGNVPGDRAVRAFAQQVSKFPVTPHQALREFDTLLHRHYGERRFRPFHIHTI